jgi:hypothetical protein
LVKEEVREMWGLAFLDRFKQDMIYALRGMRKSPGFTVMAALSLALGVGANTAILTLLNAVLLKSLPVAAPEQLVQIGGCVPRSWPQQGRILPTLRYAAPYASSR